MYGGQLSDVGAVKGFAQAGNATFTIKSLKTKTRYTYRVRRVKDSPVYFVSVLTGSDNEGDYTYLGTLRGGTYNLGRRSRMGASAPSHVAFDWFWKHVAADRLPTTVQCWHEGRCGRCGRKLTVPESVERGIGPECAGRMQ